MENDKADMIKIAKKAAKTVVETAVESGNFADFIEEGLQIAKETGDPDRLRTVMYALAYAIEILAYKLETRPRMH